MAAAVENYSDPDTVPIETCLKVASILRNPLYRAFQIVNLLESVAAVILIVFVVTCYRRKLPIHKNIEILLTTLFLACLCHAVTYTVAKIYQLQLSFFTANPCHLFLPQAFYIITHTLISYSNVCMQHMQVVMVVERIVATLWVDTYEKQCRALGAVLLAILLLLTALETIGSIGDNFAEVLMTNSLMVTDSTASGVTAAFAVIFVVCCVALLINILQYCFNLHRKKRLTLSSRYQISENIATSAMLCVISTVQLTTFAIYAFSMSYLRMTMKHDSMYDPLKETFYTVPLCTLLLPLATVVCIERTKRKRLRGIKSMVTMNASGPEGWLNYASQLQKQWE